jgi:hypothetical protein
MKVLIESIQSASEAYIMADGYMINRNNVSNWQCHGNRVISVFVNDFEYIFTERDCTEAVYDWLNPDRVDDEGLTPRWKKFVIDWANVGSPEEY